MLNTDDNKSETFDASNNVFVMTINRLSNALILFYRIIEVRYFCFVYAEDIMRAEELFS